MNIDDVQELHGECACCHKQAQLYTLETDPECAECHEAHLFREPHSHGTENQELRDTLRSLIEVNETTCFQLIRWGHINSANYLSEQVNKAREVLTRLGG
jgi:hypothetical protein